MTYKDMADGSQNVRSTSWWNNLVRKGASAVDPPPPRTIPAIAGMMSISEAQVRAEVAEDWYGVRAGEEVSARVRRLAPVLDLLHSDDVEYIEHLAKRLVDPPEVREAVANVELQKLLREIELEGGGESDNDG